MAYINITFAGVTEANRTLQAARVEIDHVNDVFMWLKGKISPDIQSRYQIAEHLSTCCRTAAEINDSLNMILKVANLGLQEYQSTEARLKRIAPSDTDILR